jgi:hypothetical protein
MLYLLGDTCVWLDLAKDVNGGPLLAACRQLIADERVEFLVPQIVTDGFERNRDRIIDAARQYPLEGIKASDLDRKPGYFEHNIHRMRYARSRKLGMFTGSGAIEAACKQIAAQRAKQASMHWTVEGAAGIIALRCQHASGRWDELWPSGPTPRGCAPSDRQQDSDTHSRTEQDHPQQS